MTIKKIGFIGTGVMGAPMAGHLLKAGYELNVFTRTPSKAQGLIEQGAHWCNSPKECAQDCDVVISIVGYPQDVEQTWADPQTGAFYGMKAGAIGVDMTTSLPSLAQKLYTLAQSLNLHMADCPVTGGDIGAKNATLTLLFGGEKEIFESLQEVFKCLGKNAHYFGEAGKGQLAKACNQIAVAATMFSACEALRFAQGVGLNPQQVIDALGAGAASSFSLTSYGPRILKDDYAPGFKIEHFVKDLKIALQTAQEVKLELPCLELTLKTYAQLQEQGLGSNGTQALYKFYTGKQSFMYFRCGESTDCFQSYLK